MNEIKRCSLSGVGFTFEADAYKRLSDYLDWQISRLALPS